MFYLKEVIYRCQYYLLSFFITTVLCYSSKSILLFLLAQSVVSFYDQQNSLIIDHFIYTHPVELFRVQVFLIIYFSILFTIPILIWTVVDFLKSSFVLLEYRNICKAIFFLFSLTILFNKVFCFNIFPKIWFFFYDFNKSTETSQTFSFFLELRIYEYFSFLMNFFYLINISFGLFVICVSIFALKNFKKLIYWKKLFIFLNIMFATLLSPPDIYTQLFIFIFLTLLFESLIFVCLFYVKYSKHILLNMVTY